MIRRGQRVETVAGWFVQLAALAGLPLALWKLAGNPIPSRLPTWLDIQDWWAGVQLYPASALDIVPRIVVDALWIAWAWYTAWTLFGLLWELLHLPAVLLPRILLHLTPRTTVQAITAGAVAATPAVHAAPAPAHTALGTHPLPADLTGRLHLSATAEKPAPRLGFPLSVLFHPALQNAPVHTVAEGDTLWDLAVHYYGDGEQWRRIFAGNIGHQQPDGKYLTNPDLILPGWTLTIPHRTTPGNGPATAPDPSDNTGATATRPPTAPNGPRTPAPSRPTPTTAPPRRTPPPAPTPAPMRPAHPDGPGQHPAADPRVPHTVGWHPPEGGYIGITLIAASATAVAVLKTRARLRPDTEPPIPPIAEQLAAVGAAAKTAKAYGYLPDEHPGASPPPLHRPLEGISSLGIHHSEQHEDWYTPTGLEGPLVYQGPCAEDAVRAFTLSLLAAEEPGPGPGIDLIVTDQHLAADLLGATQADHIPGWLHIHPTPTDAVTEFTTLAKRRAILNTDIDDYTPTTQDPHVTLILRADRDLHPAITHAQRSDPAQSIAAVLLGPLPDPDEHTTLITLDDDGNVTDATGPEAGPLRGLIAQRLPRDSATALYRAVHTTHTPLDPDPRPTALSPTAAATRAPTRTDLAQSPAIPPTPAQPPNTPPPTEPPEHASTPPGKPDPGPATTPPIQPTDPRTLTDTPLLVRVLGPIDILGPTTNIPATGDRTAALLALLALHPKGLTTDQLAELAWDTTTRLDGASPVHTAITRTRNLLRTAHPNPQAPGTLQGRYVVKDPARRFRLDPQQITTDLALLAHLEQQAQRTTDPTERRRLLTAAVELYRGPLADGLGDNSHNWLTPARHEVTTRIARLHLALANLADDPSSTVEHLTAATRLATGDAHTTTAAIHAYRRLGRPDLADTAYHDHERELETLGAHPDPETTQLAAETTDSSDQHTQSSVDRATHTRQAGQPPE